MGLHVWMRLILEDVSSISIQNHKIADKKNHVIIHRMNNKGSRHAESNANMFQATDLDIAMTITI